MQDDDSSLPIDAQMIPILFLFIFILCIHVAVGGWEDLCQLNGTWAELLVPALLHAVKSMNLWHKPKSPVCGLE